MSLLHLVYNVNDPGVVQSFQYGSDTNGNVCSELNIASYPIYDGANNQIGNVQFIDSGVAPVSTNNFQNSTQLYNETGTFFIEEIGTIVYNYSFISSSAFFGSGLVLPTVISASGVYYNKINQIAINVNDDGTRDVWISFK